jgi:ketosteroid isomerase-like protein
VPRWIAKAPTILSVTADYHGRQNVSHIFRRENGEWKIAHRHTDYVPIDQTLREAV